MRKWLRLQGLARVRQFVVLSEGEQPYEESCAQVGRAVERFTNSPTGLRSLNSAVPTELLAGEVALPLRFSSADDSIDGFVRLLSRRPCTVLATIYAIVVILTTVLVFAGDLSISVDSDLFVRADNPEVKRNRLARQLQYGAASHHDWSGCSHRRALADASPPHEPELEAAARRLVRVSAPRASASCSSRSSSLERITIVYMPRDGSNILSPRLLQQARLPHVPTGHRAGLPGFLSATARLTLDAVDVRSM